MLKSVIFAVLVMSGIVMPTASVKAEVDCSLLDPRATVSTEKEGKISASVNTLFKIAKAGSNVEGRIKDEIHNLQKGSTVTEKSLIELRTLYLFCGMVANAKDITTDRKVTLFNQMMKAQDKAPKRVKQKTTKQKGTVSNKDVIASRNDGQKGNQPQMTSQPNQQTKISVTSQGQTGGITAQTVIINNTSPTTALEWKGAFEGLRQSSDAKTAEPFATRMFSIPREKGKTLTLGPCPSDQCMVFELGDIRTEDGVLVQEIFLEGDGFGVKRRPESKYLVQMDRPVRLRGASLGIPFGSGKMSVSFALHRDSSFDMFTRIADIRITTADVNVDRLKLFIEIRHPSGYRLAQ